MYVAGISGFGALILSGPKDPPQLISLVTGQLARLPDIFVSFFYPSETVHRPGLSKTYLYSFTMWPADVWMFLIQLYSITHPRSSEILNSKIFYLPGFSYIEKVRN
jgi:hypothetical protein